MQNTSEVESALREVAALLEFSRAPKFKVKAYERAAQVVSAIGELAPLVERGELQELEGIGPSLARQISELWNTGASQYLERLRGELPAGASELVQVAGITPRRLRVLVDALGVRSVAELRAACAEQRVRALPGFGAKSEARLLQACDAWLGRGEEAPPPLLLSRALERAALLESELSSVPHVERVQLAGDVRRGEETVRALEWVVLGDARRALEHLASLRQVLRTEPSRLAAHLSEGLSLQLHPAAKENWGNALVLATGDEAHLRSLAAHAASRGFALRGFPALGNDALPARSFGREDELYAALGLAFVPPELRSGDSALERAQKENFSTLVCESDIQGLVHCHTNYSDGKHSVLEMAESAHALGMKYLTITDHSPSAHYANGVSLDRLAAQWDEIALAQERVPIRILRGTEADILQDGQLDYPDAVLEQFDVVIASIHARHRMDRAAMTERLTRALSLPIFKIWGHGLGRILNRRPAIDCDVEAVLDALGSAPGAIELNADPHRLDLPPTWIPAARARRIPFVISVDAHSTRGFGVLRYGVTMARRGGVPRAEVLNTRGADGFAQSVHPTRFGAVRA
ncbi:MAG TPA: helix-hairpin-helix domain-containing protein [Polyangiaceae bacterium]|nr:helix-hairpin-helix domain-containing protein [Polyangiaceae bacterium]